MISCLKINRAKSDLEYVQNHVHQMLLLRLTFKKQITIAGSWKQPKWSIKVEWIKKWYIYTMEYYSVIWKNWVICRDMNGFRVCQSEVSQKEKKTNIVYLHCICKCNAITLQLHMQCVMQYLHCIYMHCKNACMCNLEKIIQINLFLGQE